MKRRSKRTIKKKSYKRKMSIARPLRAQSLLNVKRTFWYENWTPGTGSTAGFWRYYQLAWSNMPSYTEFQAIFDQFRVRGVKFTFRPRYDSFAGNDTVDTTLPGITNQGTTYLHIITDPDSTVAPSGTYTSTNLNTFLEQGSVKSRNAIRPVSVYFKPKVLQNVNSVNNRPVPCPWLNTDASSAATPLKGFHVYAQDVNNTGTFGQSFDVFVTYYFQCKSLR